jgi:hypothetical protein
LPFERLVNFLKDSGKRFWRGYLTVPKTKAGLNPQQPLLAQASPDPSGCLQIK